MSSVFDAVTESLKRPASVALEQSPAKRQRTHTEEQQKRARRLATERARMERRIAVLRKHASPAEQSIGRCIQPMPADFNVCMALMRLAQVSKFLNAVVTLWWMALGEPGIRQCVRSANPRRSHLVEVRGARMSTALSWKRLRLFLRKDAAPCCHRCHSARIEAQWDPPGRRWNTVMLTGAPNFLCRACTTADARIVSVDVVRDCVPIYVFDDVPCRVYRTLVHFDRAHLPTVEERVTALRLNPTLLARQCALRAAVDTIITVPTQLYLFRLRLAPGSLASAVTRLGVRDKYNRLCDAYANWHGLETRNGPIVTTDFAFRPSVFPAPC